MDEGTDTVVGFPAFRPSVEPATAQPRDPIGLWTLESLARRDPQAEASARLEAIELARALAAQAVALAPDADTREYADRLETLERTVWPARPLDGFDLQSSLGAFLVARVAMSWAPPTTSQLRESPLDREGLLMALRDLGLAPRTATNLAGDFEGPPPGFTPDPAGLGAGRLACVAEGGATHAERQAVLAQLAYSPRCLARLATATSCLERVRRVLPALPSARLDLGMGYVPAVAALLLGRPDRTLDLIGHRPSHPALIALAELARAERALARGERFESEADPSLVTAPSAPARPSLAPRRSMSAPPMPMEDDDVVDVVEERIADESEPPARAEDGSRADRGPRVPSWAGEIGFDGPFLAQWTAARRASASIAAQLPRVLGLLPKSGSATLPDVPIPPEPRVLAALIDREGLASTEASSNANTDRLNIAALRAGRWAAMALPDPQLASVRAAIRVIGSAVEGWPPTEEAIEGAGDLEWLLVRARALALGAAGDLAGAEAMAARLSGPLPDDLRWVEARRRRYGAGPAPVAAAAEVRRAGAALVRDLAEAMARSISGALV